MERKVGDLRTFSNMPKVYQIKEILEQVNDITLEWTWTDSVCPNCKCRTERKVTHTFYRIEVLVEQDKANPKDIEMILMGYTLDGRTMIIPSEKYDQIFNKTDNYKHLVKGGK